MSKNLLLVAALAFTVVSCGGEENPEKIEKVDKTVKEEVPKISEAMVKAQTFFGVLPTEAENPDNAITADKVA